MRFSWIVLLLLSFPVLEAIGIFWVASAIGGWVLLWLLLAAVVGVMLIRVERVAWGARLLFSVQSGATSAGLVCLPVAVFCSPAACLSSPASSAMPSRWCCC